MKTIDTDKYSNTLRRKGIDINSKSILITKYSGTEQEKDLTAPPNCNDFGRVRHFKFKHGNDWPTNPLPIAPAARALGISLDNEIRAQVFQNAVCNWRCWYCFVDFKLLSGNRRFSDFLTCEEMVDLYSNQADAPPMIDLTGGQPDLTPEWIPWMMEALTNAGLSDKVFLWSDDNLSNDYFWRYLSDAQIELVSSYKMYGRVCCFKGIDENSFHFNTNADPNLHSRQFELFERMLSTGIDLYSYITLTAPTNTNFECVIPHFLDKIQAVSEYYPARIVPLKIYEFTPVVSRMSNHERDLLNGQFKAIEVWNKELERRVPSRIRSLPITEIPLHN